MGGGVNYQGGLLVISKACSSALPTMEGMMPISDSILRVMFESWLFNVLTR